MNITFQSIEEMNEEEALETVAYLVEKRGLLKARVRYEGLAPQDVEEHEEEIAKLGWLISSARFRAKRLTDASRGSADVPEHELRQQLLNARRQILELKTRIKGYEARLQRRGSRRPLSETHTDVKSQLKRRVG